MLRPTLDTLLADVCPRLAPDDATRVCALSAALQLEGRALRYPLQVLQRTRPRRLRLAKADRWLGMAVPRERSSSSSPQRRIARKHVAQQVIAAGGYGWSGGVVRGSAPKTGFVASIHDPRCAASESPGELPVVPRRRLNGPVTALIQPGPNPYCRQASVGDEDTPGVQSVDILRVRPWLEPASRTGHAAIGV
jgi:hypothetical protein